MVKNDIRKNKLKEGEIIPICFDYVFSNIFNDKENIIILENFLSTYFDLPLKEIKGNIKLLPRELKLESKKEANKQIDLILNLKGEYNKSETKKFFCNHSCSAEYNNKNRVIETDIIWKYNGNTKKGYNKNRLF